MGFDFDLLAKRGLVPKKTNLQMQAKCQSCLGREMCQRMLDANKDHLDAPPTYCPNNQILSFLKRALPQKK
ncbi:hypothetical protein EOK75_04830 [Pseudorhodobacter turbinis]|uniref:DUF6455 domain-containing protein n=2 Tax=Pseudorhodobacter turbinis TaxID=2500533 RepID=A0A4P8EEI5_9RHOB|nr:hypothetical protein EOK75_04830 [Pseudorhodobacter turbinis]